MRFRVGHLAVRVVSQPPLRCLSTDLQQCEAALRKPRKNSSNSQRSLEDEASTLVINQCLSKVNSMDAVNHTSREIGSVEASNSLGLSADSSGSFSLRKASAVHAQLSDAKGKSVSIGAELSEHAEVNLVSGKARQTTESSVHGELKQQDGAGNAQFYGAELRKQRSEGHEGPDEFCAASLTSGQQRSPGEVVVTKRVKWGETEHDKVDIEVSGKAGIRLNEVTESSVQKNGGHTRVEVKQGCQRRRIEGCKGSSFGEGKGPTS